MMTGVALGTDQEPEVRRPEVMETDGLGERSVRVQVLVGTGEESLFWDDIMFIQDDTGVVNPENVEPQVDVAELAGLVDGRLIGSQ